MTYKDELPLYFDVASENLDFLKNISNESLDGTGQLKIF